MLENVARFYARQLRMQAPARSDLLTRFENLLVGYYRDGLQAANGIPSVRYCAQELFLSPNYFGDLVRQLTGDTAKIPIAETSERLGYDYPQHFTRQFKKHFGLTPSDFLKSKR